MKLTSVIGLGLLCAAAPSTAQTGGESRRRIDVRAATALQYDSNVFRTGSNVIGQFGGSRDDFRLTPAVTFDISLPVSRQSFFLTGSVGYDFYRKNTQLNRERISVDGGASVNFAGCNGTASAGYIRQQSDLSDLLSVVRLNNSDQRVNMGVSASCGSGRGLQSGASYRHEEVKNSLESLRVGDYTVDTIGANVGYTRPTFGTLSLYLNYNNSTYVNRFIDVGSGPQQDGIESYSTGLRFEREIGSALRGGISGGYTWVKPKLPFSEQFSGASYSADITFTPNDRFQLNVTAARDASLSNLLDIDYSITDLYALSGSYALSRSLSFSFGASHRIRDFQETSRPTAFQLAGDKTTSGNAGLNYRWNDRLSLTLDFFQERRDSDQRFLNYNNTRLALGASLQL